jgi:PhzF family phenazine biosynthesis protein
MSLEADRVRIFMEWCRAPFPASSSRKGTPMSTPSQPVIAGGTLYRLSAFSHDPNGGNPAGVWIGENWPTDSAMQSIAEDVGYSETAFAIAEQDGSWTIRYFSPKAEVSFCGHATIAAGVVFGTLKGDGRYLLHTSVGDVPVTVATDGAVRRASLTSVLPDHRAVEPQRLAAALAALGWTTDLLDPAIPPAVAYAGAFHLVIAVREHATLRTMTYDFDALKQLMLDAGWTTLQLVWRETPHLFHARNPFPVGGVVEDPATGAAAAALGGYLRDAGLIPTPCELEVRQGDDMGRPGRLSVSIPAAGGITVSGTAVMHAN